MLTGALVGGAEDLRVDVAADARALTRDGIFSRLILSLLLFISPQCLGSRKKRTQVVVPASGCKGATYG